MVEGSADAIPLLARLFGIEEIGKDDDLDEILNPLDMDVDDEDLLVSLIVLSLQKYKS